MLSAVIEPSMKQYEGMNFEQIGMAMKKDPRDAVMDIVAADRGRSDVIISIMEEADVRAGLASPLMAIGTEVASPRLGLVPPHSREVRSRRTPADARRRRPTVHVAAGPARRHD